MRYQYQGKLDPESGRFKGQGSLTFLAQEEASRFSRRPGLDTVDRIGEEETCIIDNKEENYKVEEEEDDDNVEEKEDNKE